MRSALSWVLTLLWLAAVPVTAECVYPSAAALRIPNGDTATEEEMLEAQASVKVYVAAVEDFLACLERELYASGAEPSPESMHMRDLRHNAAVTAMEEVAERYNVQVRKYKARMEAQ